MRYSMQTFIYKAVIVMMTSFILNGCNKDDEDLKAFIAKTDSRSSSTTQPLPKVKPYDRVITYTASNLRDPFSAQVANKKNKSNSNLKPDKHRKKQPLEAYSLLQLKFVGTLGKNDRLWALILAPNNVVYRVTNGNYMGLKDGEIIAVSRSKIQIKEIVSDAISGEYEEKMTSMTLSAGSN